MRMRLLQRLYALKSAGFRQAMMSKPHTARMIIGPSTLPFLHNQNLSRMARTRLQQKLSALKYSQETMSKSQLRRSPLTSLQLLPRSPVSIAVALRQYWQMQQLQTSKSRGRCTSTHMNSSVATSHIYIYIYLSPSPWPFWLKGYFDSAL